MSKKKVFENTKNKSDDAHSVSGSEDNLLLMINNYVNESQNYSTEIYKQNEKALEYYYGNPMGTEVDGKSSVVSMDVADTIEWMMPQLMRMFTTQKSLANFIPQRADQENQAKQASSFVDYVWWRQNSGFLNFYNWFKDALLQKIGVLKIWWDESEKTTTEEYKGLSEAEKSGILTAEADDDIEIIEEEEITTFIDVPQIEMNPVTGQPEQIMVEVEVKNYDITISRTTRKGQVRIDLIPPEEFLIEREAMDVDEALYLGHKRRMTLTALRELFPDEEIEDSISDATGMGYDSEYLAEKFARGSFDKTSTFIGQRSQNPKDPSIKEVEVIESYLKVDWDGDGKAELRKVTTVGKTILDNVPVDDYPFVVISPILIPHKFVGMSLADFTKDIQEVKTALLRLQLDNAYLQNNSKMEIVENQVNIDDLLNSTAGAIVRVKRAGAIQPIPVPQLSSDVFGMMEYMDKIREARTGVGQNQKGVGADSINTHVTQIATMSDFTMSQGRIELIARVFADVGVAPALRKIYNLVQRNETQDQFIKLDGKYAVIRPTEWRDEMDLTVDVGLGHGNKDQNAMHLNNLAQTVGSIAGTNPQLVPAQQQYNFFAEQAYNANIPNPEKFVLDPSTNPKLQKTPPEGPSMEDVAMKRVEVDGKKAQAELQQKQQEIMISAQLDQAKMKLEAAKLMLEAQKAQKDGQIADAGILIEKMKLLLNAEEIQIEAQIGMNVKGSYE